MKKSKSHLEIYKIAWKTLVWVVETESNPINMSPLFLLLFPCCDYSTIEKTKPGAQSPLDLQATLKSKPFLK